MMARIGSVEAGGPRVLAALDLIAHSEIGDALLAVSEDGYNVLVGSTPAHPRLFTSYLKHPDILVTVNSAGLKSTAAGRYQFLHRTWKGLGLPDFSPENQDRGCIDLFKQVHAYVRIQSGDVRNWISMCAPIWASLPGAGYGQHENKMDDLAEAYFAALQRYTDAPNGELA
jgi:muramidase (phage lysozyme)